eukprot:TRINITY_DN9812_c0_g1_i6.p1 TRINITY_DN9812_c0_g1~~TRINITY_DN9812_c0_g1_i6.p1  ORF type:complete len:153 (-),score=18.13 TRINITY_DN9812_c0_g1_i6:92-490(-)
MCIRDRRRVHGDSFSLRIIILMKKMSQTPFEVPKANLDEGEEPNWSDNDMDALISQSTRTTQSETLKLRSTIDDLANVERTSSTQTKRETATNRSWSDILQIPFLTIACVVMCILNIGILLMSGIRLRSVIF